MPVRLLPQALQLEEDAARHAIEGRTDEWTQVERDMLERIDWQREQFRFPGIEAFDVPPSEPGA
ncbi:MAG TPA: hypothetical protein VF157_08360 [Chloroflexota bacterium]